MHQQGHKPPKYLSADGDHSQLVILHDFINQQFKEKFSQDIEEIDFQSHKLVKEN